MRWLKNYFMLCGLLGHVLLATIWLTWPELVLNAKQKLRLELQGVGLMAAPAAVEPVASDLPAQISQVFKAWQAEPQPQPEKTGIWLNHQQVADLTTAMQQLKNGDLLQIGAGTYQQALTIQADDVTIEGLGAVLFETATVNDKAMFLIKGNRATLKNLQCRNIKVSDGNGSCVRLEGQGLTLDHIYFYASQSGVLETSGQGGTVYVNNSRFEQLGHGGQAHGIYLNSANLHFHRSLMIAAKDGGHGIKSRGGQTIISESILASLGSDDSRLVDISNGGELSIEDSILQEGAQSQNFQLIGFGLEGLKYLNNKVQLQRNLILSDRAGQSQLIKVANDSVSVIAKENLLIGDILQNYPDNRLIADREQAGIAKAPALPFTKAICGSTGQDNPRCPLQASAVTSSP